MSTLRRRIGASYGGVLALSLLLGGCQAESRILYLARDAAAVLDILYQQYLADPQATTAPWLVWPQSGPGQCTGALISSQHVLTAGHCETQFSNAQVYVGSSALKASVARICVNPHYKTTPPSLEDLMVVELTMPGTKAEALSYSQDATSIDKPYLYGVATLSGAVKSARSGYAANLLSVSTKKLVAWRRADLGDSGGPLVLHDSTPQLVGTLSGRADSLRTKDQYVHIKGHRDWIKKVLASSDPRADGLCKP